MPSGLMFSAMAHSARARAGINVGAPSTGFARRPDPPDEARTSHETLFAMDYWFADLT